jgi:hypothetical protein
VSALVYFDTDFFHHFASAFERRALADDLRDKILLSPMTMKEVFSHLAVEWGPQVHGQIRGLPNWLNSKNTRLLPWMTDAAAKIAFDVPLPDDGFTHGMQENVNELLNYELEDVLETAEAIRDELDKIKTEYAGYFKETVNYFRAAPLTESLFTQIWVNGVKNRLHLEKNTTPTAQVVEALSAYHEFEFSKLVVALANKGSYNAVKHRNDLFDAEQLVYLKDPSLHFLTADRGYLRKVVKSPFRDRIHEVRSPLLADAASLESLLRQITCPVGRGHK